MIVITPSLLTPSAEILLTGSSSVFTSETVVKLITIFTTKLFLPQSRHFSVDEIMIPYFGRHSTKQYIRGKPVRYGFKVWSLCTSDGAGMKFEPYCGKHTDIRDNKLGQGPNVVIDLVTKAELVTGSEGFFDNLFTSFPLLDKL